MAPIEVTIAGYQGAVCAQILAAFPDFKIVEFDREEEGREELALEDLPALLLDITEFEPQEDDDRGTGQLAARARVEARLIVPYRTTSAKTAARTLALSICAWLRLKRFTSDTVKTEPAHVLGAYRDEFAGQDRYVVWRVEWTQVLQVGTNIYAEDFQPVPGVKYSYAPDIGLGHEPDYQPV